MTAAAAPNGHELCSLLGRWPNKTPFYEAKRLFSDEADGREEVAAAAAAVDGGVEK